VLVGKKPRQRRQRPPEEGDRREPETGGRALDEAPPQKRRPYRKRRQFSVDYKLAIVLAAESLTERGQVAEMLRREELNWAHLSQWRRDARRGELKPSRGQMNQERDLEAEAELRQLRRKNERLEARLRQAEAIIQLQKKASEILGVDLPDDDESY